MKKRITFIFLYLCRPRFFVIQFLEKKTKIGQKKRTYYVFPKEMFYICKNLKKTV